MNRTHIEKAITSSSICLLNKKNQNEEFPLTKVKNKATAFYVDSSGRAPLTLTIRLKCNSLEDSKLLIDSGCFNLDSNNDTIKEEDNEEEEVEEEEKQDKKSNNINVESQFLIECEPRPTSSTTNNTPTISVEYVSIVKSKVLYTTDKEIEAFEFDVNLMTNVFTTVTSREELLYNARATPSVIAEESASEANNETAPSSTINDEFFCRPIRATIEIKGVLEYRLGGGMSSTQPSQERSSFENIVISDSLGLEALELGGSGISLHHQHSEMILQGGNNSSSTDHYGIHYTQTQPILLELDLVKALNISVIETGGARAASGATLVSLTIAHSNQHEEDVTVTNIALHPGHSCLQTNTIPSNSIVNTNPPSVTSQQNQPGRHTFLSSTSSSILGTPSFTKHRSSIHQQQYQYQQGRSMQGGESSVIDMSHYCSWNYTPGTAPKLPIQLSPNEAFSTVLQIDAWEEHYGSRTFHSPISVTATVTQKEDVTLSTHCKWTTARIAFSEQPVDAFRIDMSLVDAKFMVGAPFVVSLQVLNLSHDDRDLMLLMAKDEDLNEQNNLTLQQQQQHHSVNTAVVSEVNGYTFGVWGLAGEDDGTIRHNRDHELLAVDAALLLGEVKGQHSIQAELRFVPLREGTLDVPNLKLYDKLGGRWYDCVHMLKIVASAN